MYRRVYLGKKDEIAFIPICFWKSDAPALKAVAERFIFPTASMFVVSIQVFTGWFILCKTGERRKFSKGTIKKTRLSHSFFFLWLCPLFVPL